MAAILAFFDALLSFRWLICQRQCPGNEIIAIVSWSADGSTDHDITWYNIPPVLIVWLKNHNVCIPSCG